MIDAALEGVRLAQQAGARDVEASALSLLAATTLWGLDRPVDAEALYLALGNPRGALQALHGRMGCLYRTRRYALAIEMGTQLQTQAHKLGNVEAEIVSLNMLVACHTKPRRYAEALDTSQLEASTAQAHHKVYNIVHALATQGHLLARLRRPEDAAVMSAFSERCSGEHLGPLSAPQQRDAAKVRRREVFQIGRARWDECRARGVALPAREGLRLGCGG